jgi:hypothetical protein
MLSAITSFPNPIGAYLLNQDYFMYLFFGPMIGLLVICVWDGVHRQTFRQISIHACIYGSIYVAYICVIAGMPLWSAVVVPPICYFLFRFNMNGLENMIKNMRQKR